MRTLMIDEFCRLGVEWVSHNDVALRLNTSWFRLISKILASFFMKTLETASNQIGFVVKWYLGLLVVLHRKPIDASKLISKNIKYMANSPKWARGHFCMINKLWRIDGVLTHQKDEMTNLMAQINKKVQWTRCRHDTPWRNATRRTWSSTLTKSSPSRRKSRILHVKYAT